MSQQERLKEQIRVSLVTLRQGRAVAQAVKEAREQAELKILQAKFKEAHEMRDKAFEAAKTTHDAEVKRIGENLQRIESAAGLGALPWTAPAWSAYISPETAVSAVRVGTLKVETANAKLSTTALINWIGGRNLVIKAKGPIELQEASHALQSLLLRLFTLIPPTKLRMRILDPVGHGQNGATFMHMLDYMPELVGEKIWVSPADMEAQLANLSDDMDTVIQTYFRGHYTSIEHYNQDAGEVAEPYRLLSVFNFPVDFTPQAVKQLISLAENGPRCGFFTLMTMDTSVPLPPNSRVRDLLSTADVISRDDKGNWRFEGGDLCPFTLELDDIPTTSVFEKLVITVGQAATKASEVQVPFQKSVPSQETWWNEKSDAGLSAPIGVCGARKLQSFELGRGTAQHALVAGQTGSGKTSLLHALILSLAIRYSPEELGLYLIDFKKGVEFKDYGAYQLPHARVVAIQSEREFGLSILEHLDLEMERRGEIFRTAQCTSLPEYRILPAENPVRKQFGLLPRLLLIVDEFQEFFSSRDQISQDAGRLLDRLTRQGRAFGVHVFLGSQSLSGVSMGQASFEQIAVRIALQCSAEDSRAVLAMDNPAARLLTRPGEGFYNAVSGKPEGNVRFQTAWVSDQDRVGLLTLLRGRADSSQFGMLRPIVFEGDVLPDIGSREDHPLNTLLDNQGEPPWPKEIRAFVGEPMNISGASVARFARRPGRNLLVVTRDEAVAKGVMATSLLSMAAHKHLGGATFLLADMSVTGADDPTYVHLIKTALPDLEVLEPRELAARIQQLAGEVQERLSVGHKGRPSVYVVILGLNRGREFRRPSGYSSYRKSETPSASDYLEQILRDGPEVGVHVLMWTETVAAFEGVVGRQGLEQIGVRLATTLADSDSRAILGSLDAVYLQANRALLFDDERMGSLEKLRPYRCPSPAYMQGYADKLRSFRSKHREGE